jgi:putative transposase
MSSGIVSNVSSHPDLRMENAAVTRLSTIFNAIFYLLRTGCPWRSLPSRFPPWQTVYYHFKRFERTGLWLRLFRALRVAERQRVGKEPHPSAAIMDAQSVKTVEESARVSGYDAHTCVKGRKRHLLVDTLGLPISSYVTPADMHDTQGARRLLAGLKFVVPRLKKIWADSAYQGRELADWCKAQGDSRSRSSRTHARRARLGACFLKDGWWSAPVCWLARNQCKSKDDERKVQTSDTLDPGGDDPIAGGSSWTLLGNSRPPSVIKRLALWRTHFAPLQRWLWDGERQAEPKRRSRASRTLDADLSLMLLNDGATNMQPQAQSDPAAALDLDSPGSVEGFPDALVFLWRQPWPRIAHPDTCLLVIYLEANHDGAIGWRIFEGIRQVVRHDLPEAMGIGHHRHPLLRWALQQNRALQIDLALLLDRLADDGNQIRRCQAELQPARPDARRFHQIIDEPVELLLLALGLLDRLQEKRGVSGLDPLALEQTPNAPFDHLQSKLNACQWVFEFVPDDAQEGFHLCRGFAESFFPLSVEPLIIHRCQALAHQRQPKESQGNQRRNQGIEHFLDQFSSDEQHNTGEQGRGNRGGDTQAGDEVLPPQVWGRRYHMSRAHPGQCPLREPEPYQARQREQQIEGQPEQIRRTT